MTFCWTKRRSLVSKTILKHWLPTRAAIVVQTFSQRKYLEIAPLACLQKKWRKSPMLALASLLAKKRKKIGENPLLAACTHSFANLVHNQQQSSLLDRVEIFLCSTKWYILTPTAKTWLHWFWKVTSLYEWAKHSLYTTTLLSMDILNEGGGEERINWLISKE